MIEVFKTNITHQWEAQKLIEQVQAIFAGYIVNFDLDDCDKILRVECKSGIIQSEILIKFLNTLGCLAEILPDEAELLKE
jgi:hypothetical protein